MNTGLRNIKLGSKGDSGLSMINAGLAPHVSVLSAVLREKGHQLRPCLLPHNLYESFVVRLDMFGDYFDQLPRSIVTAYPRRIHKSFAFYVWVMLATEKWDRAKLARETGLSEDLLARLVTGLLQRDELSKEEMKRVEQQFSISYHNFLRLISGDPSIARLRHRWEQSRFGS